MSGYSLTPPYSSLPFTRSMAPQKPRSASKPINEAGSQLNSSLLNWNPSSNDSPISKMRLSTPVAGFSPTKRSIGSSGVQWKSSILDNFSTLRSPKTILGPSTTLEPSLEVGKASAVHDIHEKMHYHIDMNVMLNAEKKELETLILEERRNFDSVQRQLEVQIEKERKGKNDVERHVNSLMNELGGSRRESENLKRRLGEIEGALEQKEKENQKLIEENRRNSDSFTIRMRDLEDRLKHAQREVNASQQLQLNERNTLNREHELRANSISREWEMRLHQVEEQLRMKSNECHELEAEVHRNREYLRKLIIETEEKMLSFVAQIRDEETRKYTLPLKELEAKLNLALEEKDSMNHAFQGLLCQMDAKEKQFRDKLEHCEEENIEMRNEVGSLQVELENSQSLIQRIKQEVESAQRETHRMSEKATELDLKLREAQEKHLMELDGSIERFNMAKDEWQSQNSDLRNKILDLEHLCQKYETEVKRVSSDYKRLREGLHSNLNQTIDQVMVDHKDLGDIISPIKTTYSGFGTASKAFF